MRGAKRAGRMIAVVGAVVALAACGGEQEARPVTKTVKAVSGPSAVELAALRAEAAQVFADRCARCHGVSGAGNGVASDDLIPSPRNFQDPGWQRSVKNAYLEQIIVEGGVAVGKAASMPAHADLASRKDLVVELRRYIRDFAH